MALTCWAPFIVGGNMISTEKLYDMLPAVTDLYDKLELDTCINELKEKDKDSALLLGISLFKYILKNSGKVKDEVFEIVSIFEEKTVEEVKAQSFALTINSLRKIFTDKDITDFLTPAMK